MYKLLNGKKINEDKVIRAMLDYAVATEFFLDSKNGEVVAKKKRNQPRLKEYFQIPKFKEKDIISRMEWMARELVAFEDLEHAKDLLEILKKENPIKNYHKAIEGNWSHGWPQCEQDFAYEKMEEWFEE